MEDNQIIDNIGDENSKLFITREGRELLFQAANWSLFFVVIGFIMLAFNALMGLAFFWIGSRIPEGQPGVSEVQMIFPITGAFFLVITALFIFPFVKLLNFANIAKKAARQEDSAQLTLAFRHLKEHYKWFGLLFVGSIVLSIVGSMIFGAMQTMSY